MDALNQIDGGDFPRGGSGDSAVAALAPAMVVHEDVEMFGVGVLGGAGVQRRPSDSF